MKKNFKLLALALLACATIYACKNNTTEAEADTVVMTEIEEEALCEGPADEVAEVTTEEAAVKETVKKEATKAANKVVKAAAETATEVATEAVKEEAKVITNTTSEEKEALKAKTSRRKK